MFYLKLMPSLSLLQGLIKTSDSESPRRRPTPYCGVMWRLKFNCRVMLNAAECQGVPFRLYPDASNFERYDHTTNCTTNRTLQSGIARYTEGRNYWNNQGFSYRHLPSDNGPGRTLNQRVIGSSPMRLTQTKARKSGKNKARSVFSDRAFSCLTATLTATGRNFCY